MPSSRTGLSAVAAYANASQSLGLLSSPSSLHNPCNTMLLSGNSYSFCLLIYSSTNDNGLTSITPYLQSF